MARPPIRLLLVDDDLAATETIGAVLEHHGFQVRLAGEVREALRLLDAQQFDAVVTDMLFDGMPEGAEVVRAARDLQPAAAVIVMTAYPAVDGAVSAMRCGARDYLPKPVDPSALTARIHQEVRAQQLGCASLEFAELVSIVSDMVANTIERIDPYTAGHGQRTRRYCDVLAGRVGLDAATRERLQLAAIAHDYGKIWLEDQGFLTKQGPLTDQEYRQVKRHPELGAEKLGPHVCLKEVCRWVAEHHERWDGRGYPRGLEGEEISLPGRILGVVEVFDSLATRRSYKRAWPLQKVMDFFEDHRGKNFDPDVCDVFLEELSEHGEAWMAQPQHDVTAAGYASG